MWKNGKLTFPESILRILTTSLATAGRFESGQGVFLKLTI